MNPFDYLNQATKNFPAANLVWIAIAVATAATLISSFDEPMTLIAGSLFVVAAIFVFGVFAAVYNAVNAEGFQFPGLKTLVAFLAWSFSLMLVIFVGMMLYSFVTGGVNAVSKRLAATAERTGVLPPEIDEVEAPPEDVQETQTPVGPPPSPIDVENASVGLEPSGPNFEQCILEIDRDSLNVEEFEIAVRLCDEHTSDN